MAIRRLLHSISNVLDPILLALNRIRRFVSGVYPQRPTQTSERAEWRRRHWLRRLSIVLAFFALGIVAGFTTILSGYVSETISSKQRAFSFAEVATAGNAQGDLMINEAFIGEKQEAELSFAEVTAEVVVAAEKEDGNFEPPTIPPTAKDMDSVSGKLLIIVTATNPRPFQAHHLSRLAYTLRNVPPPLLWLVVEMHLASPETARILRDSGVMYRNMVSYKHTTAKNRTVHQRNLALAHIEKHQLDGIVYFADDSGIYSAELFEQMREIRRFGTWPVVTLINGKNAAITDGPICDSHQVIGWHQGNRRTRSRRFHANILGFAFNSTMIWDRKRWPQLTLEPIRLTEMVFRGVHETSAFIDQLVEDESQMEGLPGNCSKIMVWNENLEAPKLVYPLGWLVQKNLEVVVPI